MLNHSQRRQASLHAHFCGLRRSALPVCSTKVSSFYSLPLRLIWRGKRGDVTSIPSQKIVSPDSGPAAEASSSSRLHCKEVTLLEGRRTPQESARRGRLCEAVPEGTCTIWRGCPKNGPTNIRDDSPSQPWRPHEALLWRSWRGSAAGGIAALESRIPNSSDQLGLCWRILKDPSVPWRASAVSQASGASESLRLLAHWPGNLPRAYPVPAGICVAKGSASKWQHTLASAELEDTDGSLEPGAREGDGPSVDGGRCQGAEVAEEAQRCRKDGRGGEERKGQAAVVSAGKGGEIFPRKRARARAGADVNRLHLGPKGLTRNKHPSTKRQNPGLRKLLQSGTAEESSLHRKRKGLLRMASSQDKFSSGGRQDSEWHTKLVTIIKKELDFVRSHVFGQKREVVVVVKDASEEGGSGPQAARSVPKLTAAQVDLWDGGLHGNQLTPAPEVDIVPGEPPQQDLHHIQQKPQDLPAVSSGNSVQKVGKPEGLQAVIPGDAKDGTWRLEGLPAVSTISPDSGVLHRLLAARLAKWHGRVTSMHATMALNNESNVQLSMAFFNWAKSQPKLSQKVKLYTKLISIAGEAEDLEPMEMLKGEMVANECVPNAITVTQLLRAYVRANRLDKAVEALEWGMQHGVTPKTYTIRRLLEGLSKAERYGDSVALFERLRAEGVKFSLCTYNTMLTLLGNMGHLPKAQGLLTQMVEDGLTPDKHTYTRLICQFCNRSDITNALATVETMTEAGIVPDAIVFNPIIANYIKRGKQDEALMLLERMRELGIEFYTSTYNILMDMYAHGKNVAKAKELFLEMQAKGVALDKKTYNIMTHAYLEAGQLANAKEMLRTFQQVQKQLDLRTYTMLLNACFECNNREEVNCLLDMIESVMHPMHGLVTLLFRSPPGTNEARLWAEVRTHLKWLDGEDIQIMQGFCNEMVQWLWKAGWQARAGQLLKEVGAKGIYCLTRQQGAKLLVDLHDMATPTAIVATRLELMTLRKVAMQGGIFPKAVGIITGWGRSTHGAGSKVQRGVEALLDHWESPFKRSMFNNGRLHAKGIHLKPWLLQPGMLAKLELKNTVLEPATQAWEEVGRG